VRRNEDEEVRKIYDLESDGFLLSRRLDRLCVYVDFKQFLFKRFS
jgi:hypothetical protein